MGQVPICGSRELSLYSHSSGLRGEVGGHSRSKCRLWVQWPGFNPSPTTGFICGLEQMNERCLPHWGLESLREWKPAGHWGRFLAYAKCSMNARYPLEKDARPSSARLIHLQPPGLCLHGSSMPIMWQHVQRASCAVQYLVAKLDPSLLKGLHFFWISKGLLHVLSSPCLDPAKSDFLCSVPCPTTVRAVQP